MIKKFPNSGIRIMQDVPQIEAFRIPVHVELTELLGLISTSYRTVPLKVVMALGPWP